MTDRELMQQALEALEFHVKNADEIEEIDLVLVTALRERLAQPEQEPVAWMVYTEGGTSAYVTDNPNDLVGAYRALSLYTTPPQRTWVGLTDEEIADIYIKWDATPGVSMADFARAIEAKLKEKNHG